MKAWKVIFATLVIFAAGFATGSLLIKPVKPVTPAPVPQAPAAPPVPYIVQERFLQTMKRELALTPEQVKRLEAVFADSRERMQILLELINPELQAEKREVADRIRNELTPEQQAKFQELLKRPHRTDNPDGHPRRKSTNAAPSAAPAA